MDKVKYIFTGVLCFLVLCTALPMTASAAVYRAWDGKTIDVSWYNNTDTEFSISTPEQLMGLAAIVNGIYNKEITNVIGDSSVIVDHQAGEDDNSGISTNVYHYGGDDFNGKTIFLTADLDMGGVYNPETNIWSGPIYMPIGGQYLMEKDDTSTKLSSSFCGTLDGQGHYILNIYCPRHCTGNYGDGTAIGLIGRLGTHDNDPVENRPASPAICNLAVTGYIEGNRSVGGIAGKIGKTSVGALIENCANYAAVQNTDAKGCGGIVGAGWNAGTVRSCYNVGKVISVYNCPTGGIVGSNEITIENCYNVGSISAPKDSYAMAIGTTNSGLASADNCYWLEGSAPGGGYYGTNKGMVSELTESELKAAASKLGEAFTADLNKNDGYPILLWQADNETDPLAAPPLPAPAYSDVQDGIWYADAVGYVMRAGYFDLVSEEVFSPESHMTRLMLAEALYRLAGSPETGDSPFIDCDTISVAWANENGVVNGVGDGIFDPDASISREQIAAMMYRYASVQGMDTSASKDLSDFADGSAVATWAVDAMKWAVASGLINGKEETRLDPSGNATRAEVAAIFQRMIDLIIP